MRYFFLLLSLTACLCVSAQCDSFYTDYDSYRSHATHHDPSQYLSMIGMQRESLLMEDTSRGGNSKWKNIFSFEYDSTERLLTTEIMTALLPSLQHTHALVINEGHNIPTSRTNLYTMVGDLKKAGYHDIFMETLSWQDTLREKYGYPTMNTGYYSMEPMYGELLRRLIGDSIRLHAYESGYYQIDTATREGTLKFISPDYPDWIPVAADSFMVSAFYMDYGKREVSEALLIYQQLMHEHIDRYIIYCGYGHGNRTKRPLMGNILRHLTGDTMVVVDQTFLHERSSVAYDYDIYRRYAPAGHSMILSHADGSPLQIQRSAPDTGTIQLYDYYIITPRTELHNSRATWRTLGGERQYYPISRILDPNILPTRYVVLAYYMSEYSQLGSCSIPTDILQVNDKKKEPALVLRPGRKYFIKVMRAGKELFSKVYDIAE